MSAVAVLAVAAAVYVAACRERRLRRVAAAERLMAGCAHRDVAALAAQLEEFRRRLPLPVPRTPAEEAEEVLSTHDPIVPPMEGGSR